MKDTASITVQLQQDFPCLGAVLFHVPEEGKLRPGPVQVLSRTVNFEIDVSVQVIRKEPESVFQRHEAGAGFQGQQLLPGEDTLQGRKETAGKSPVFWQFQADQGKILLILGGTAGTHPDGVAKVVSQQPRHYGIQIDDTDSPGSFTIQEHVVYLCVVVGNAQGQFSRGEGIRQEPGVIRVAPGEGKFRDWATNIIYVIIVTFIIIAVSNGTNLTDGMDGLAAGTSAIVGVTVAILAYLSGNAIFADYLNIMYIPNTSEIVIFMAAFVGALIGFLWYNTYPAQVFMGDTGSLALGGIIAVAAVMIRKEFLIPIFCGIFFVESLSVLIQRYYFKYTRVKKGEGVRVFRMSPLHHHFQKENPDALIQWPHHVIPEAKITVRFWIITIILGILSVITLKIR